MLFDEAELNVFPNEESKQYFRDILQTYYSRNYRAAIVLLYSFVVYDLFEKIKVMANEGNADAKRIYSEVANDFKNRERFSEIEHKIIGFFLDKFSDYFKDFSKDIEYLQDCRHKCAHLNLSGGSLSIPKDYQVRMLICSMFDNVFSVKAPFITDLFKFVQPKIESISSNYVQINDELIEDLRKSHFMRMTNDSIAKSLHTFLKLLLLSSDSDAIKNIRGLLAFAYSLAIHALSCGLDKLFNGPEVYDLIVKIDYGEVSTIQERKDAFIYLLTNLPAFEKAVRYKNAKLFSDATKDLFKNGANFVKYYDALFSRNGDSKYSYFINHRDEIVIRDYFSMCDFLMDDPKFSLNDYVVTCCDSIPTFNGFAIADEFMVFFIEVFQQLDEETLTKAFKCYNRNSQCVNRSKYNFDLAKIVEKNNSLESPFELTKISPMFKLTH